jgi:tRNA wybutosine-synthesizing protein 2
MNLAIKVHRREAEAYRKMLLRAGVLDHSRAIMERDGMVEIPVTRKTVPGAEYVRQEDPVYRPERLSLKVVRNSLREVIGAKADRLKWELLGDVVVVSLPLETEREKREAGERLLRFFPKAKTVVNRIGIHDIFRKPRVEVLYGNGTETTHKENKCRFRMDVAKVMFSAGNLEERRRMAYISNRDEVVLDMFAGIGQFTIPMAVHSRPKKVIAIEKNPVAHGYLWENVKINRLDNVDALLGDCREKSPRGAVDRVVMGYLFRTHVFLPYAFRALRGGGVIHYHSLVRRGDERNVESAIKLEAGSAGYDATRIKRRKVKSYSPGYHHLVFDVDVERWKS